MSLKVLPEPAYRRLCCGILVEQQSYSESNIGRGKTAFSLPQRPDRFWSPHRPTLEQGLLSFFGARDFFDILVKTRDPISEKTIKMHKIEIVNFIKVKQF